MTKLSKTIPLRVGEQTYEALVTEAKRLNLPLAQVARAFLSVAVADGQGRLTIVKTNDQGSDRVKQEERP